MKRLTGAFLILISFNLLAECMDLSGSYKIQDVANDCVLEQNSGPLMIYPSNPTVPVMARPGSNYGYFLNMLVANGMDSITVGQQQCGAITISNATDPTQSWLIEVGEMPYFGARTPISVTTTLNEKGLGQTMLITKYTTVSEGLQTVFKNIKYTSSISLDENNDLITKTRFIYGKQDEKIESVTCRFTAARGASFKSQTP